VLKVSPFNGAAGFEVSPYGSCMMMPFADSDRLGFRPLAATGSKVAGTKSASGSMPEGANGASRIHSADAMLDWYWKLCVHVHPVV
jgi:hypothetical protein